MTPNQQLLYYTIINSLENVCFLSKQIEISHMVLSIIFLEDKHEYQQFFQHRICLSIQPPDYSDP
jgi:hypothetical protein